MIKKSPRGPQVNEEPDRDTIIEEAVKFQTDMVVLVASVRAVIKWAEEKQRMRAEPWQRLLIEMLKPELEKIDKAKYFER